MIGPPDSAGATECLHNVFCDVAFRMVKLRRPPEPSKISKLHSIATLLPDCLRLALLITEQHPRLATGGLLDLASRVFLPVNYLPFPRRA